MQLISFFVFALLVSAVQAQVPITKVAAVNNLIGYSVDTTLTRMLTDRLRSEIIKSGYFRVLERGQMDQILAEQDFIQSDMCNTAECQVKVGQLLGADYIIVGSVGNAQGLWSFSVKLVNVESGAIESSVDEAMSGDLPVIVNGLVPSLAVKLVKTVAGEIRTVLTSVGTGELYIKTTPLGAQVWIDDILQHGLTPLSLPGISAGKHIIRVRLDSLGAQTEVEVRPNDLVRLEPRLNTLTGNVRISTEPVDAEVWIGDTLWPERTPTILKNITVGKHPIRIEKLGYANWSDTAVAEYQQQGVVQATLEKGVEVSLKLARSPVIWSISGNTSGEITKDTTISLQAGKPQILTLHSPPQDDLVYYTLIDTIDAGAGTKLQVLYENKLDPGFVEERFQKKVRIVRWSLLGCSLIGAVLAYKFNADHAKAYDTYKALPQTATKTQFDHDWKQVEDNRTKFLAAGIGSLILLTGFGVSFAF